MKVREESLVSSKFQVELSAAVLPHGPAPVIGNLGVARSWQDQLPPDVVGRIFWWHTTSDAHPPSLILIYLNEGPRWCTTQHKYESKWAVNASTVQGCL